MSVETYGRQSTWARAPHSGQGGLRVDSCGSCSPLCFLRRLGDPLGMWLRDPIGKEHLPHVAAVTEDIGQVWHSYR